MSDEAVVQPDESITSDDKLWALLSYIIPIVAIIVLLMEDKKNRPFIKYHAVQALALGIIEFALALLVVGVCLSPLLFIYGVYCGIKAYQGEYIEIPVVTNFCKNQGWL